MAIPGSGDGVAYDAANDTTTNQDVCGSGCVVLEGVCNGSKRGQVSRGVDRGVPVISKSGSLVVDLGVVIRSRLRWRSFSEATDGYEGLTNVL
jgi:hypothetical protein